MRVFKRLVVLGVLTMSFGCNDNVIVPERITVTGRVISRGGTAVDNANVEIQGKTAVTTPDGYFSIPDVEVPYDLKIAGIAYGMLCTGLTIPNPVVGEFGISNENFLASITLKLPFNISPLQRSLMYYNPTGSRYPCYISESGRTDSSFTFDVRWFDDPVYQGNLYFLLNTTDTFSVTSFDAYFRKQDLQINNGDNIILSPASNELIDPVESTYNVNVSPAGGQWTSYGLISLSFDQYLNFLFPGSFYYSVINPAIFLVPTGIPDIPKVGYFTLVNKNETYIGKGQQIFQSSTVDFTNHPDYVSPPDNQQGVTLQTPFVWTKGAGTGIFAFRVHFHPFKTFTIITKSNAAFIPDFTSLGIPFTPDVKYDWDVLKFIGYGSVDEYATDPYLLKLQEYYYILGREFYLSNNP